MLTALLYFITGSRKKTSKIQDPSHNKLGDESKDPGERRFPTIQSPQREVVIFSQKGKTIEWWAGFATNSSLRSTYDNDYVVRITFEDGGIFFLGGEPLFETEWSLVKRGTGSFSFELWPSEGGMLDERNIQKFDKDGTPHKDNSPKFSGKIARIDVLERSRK